MRALILWPLGVFVFGTALGLMFQAPLVNALSQPLITACPNTSLLAIAPQEYFWTIIWIGLWVGIMLALPVLFWRLVEIATHRKGSAGASLRLALIAAAFAVAAYVGFQTVTETFAGVCEGDGAKLYPGILLDSYMSVAKWRPFLYGLSALIPAAALLVWWRVRRP